MFASSRELRAELAAGESGDLQGDGGERTGLCVPSPRGPASRAARALNGRPPPFPFFFLRLYSVICFN